MRIQRSWVLCVLTIIALVIAVHETRAQSYPPYPGTAPPTAGYPGIGPQMQSGIPGLAANTPSSAAQYAQARSHPTASRRRVTRPWVCRPNTAPKTP